MRVGLPSMKDPVDQASVPVSDAASLLRSLLGSSGDCIKILDLDGNLIFMTEGGQRVMEVTDFGAIQGYRGPTSGRTRAMQPQEPRSRRRKPARPDTSKVMPRRWRERQSGGTSR